MGRREHLQDLPTYVYRAYDRSGDLLYVGVTSAPEQRCKSHRGRSTWWGDSERMVWALHPDRPTALAVERAAVATERPLHNITPQELARRRSANRRREDAARRQMEAERAERHALGESCGWSLCERCEVDA